MRDGLLVFLRPFLSFYRKFAGVFLFRVSLPFILVARWFILPRDGGQIENRMVHDLAYLELNNKVLNFSAGTSMVIREVIVTFRNCDHRSATFGGKRAGNGDAGSFSKDVEAIEIKTFTKCNFAMNPSLSLSLSLSRSLATYVRSRALELQTRPRIPNR